MTSKKVPYTYIAAILSIVIPLPARTGCGLVMIFVVSILMLSCTGLKVLLKKIETGKMESLVLVAFLVFMTIICKEILVLISPALALIMSFAIFLAPVSCFLLGYVIPDRELEKNIFSVNMISTAIFFVVVLLFFIIRELLAFGSVSLPSRSGIMIFTVFPHYSVFWSTIPGGFLLLFFLFSSMFLVDRKINKAGRL